jgi:dipeptidyl aminopeptidase/acylaminoacyl peptidase
VDLRIRLLASLAVFAALLAPACNSDEEDPFAQFNLSRAPSEDAVLIYASGAWATEPGQARELFAINADGSEVERVTTCTQREDPCDFLQVAPSSIRERVAAVRGSVSGDPEASALYFIDLGRSVETIIAVARRVQAADWTIDDSFIAYSDGDVEDLFTVSADGQEQIGEPLTTTPDRRERYPRVNFQLDNAAWEALDETPGKSRIFSLRGGVDGEPVAVTEGGPGTEVLEGTPYIVGSDSTPAFSTSPILLAFRRLTGTGNGGLGTWDIMTLSIFSEEDPVVVAGGGGVYRGAPDWSLDGRIAFVETDMASGESRLVTILPDGTDRQVLHVEDAGFRMGSPRWLR